MATINKIYSDIDFTFTKKPGSGDVALSYDAQAVIRSIRNLLLTRHYERLFNPKIGSNLDLILFEMVSPIAATALQRQAGRRWAACCIAQLA
jgi:phage baseplate assembly protein W